MRDEAERPVLRLAPQPPDTPLPGQVVAVLDTTWMPPDVTPPRGSPLALRTIGERVLAGRDLIAETAEALDAWAHASGVIDAMTSDGTSFWYYVRLRHWMWLQQQILWLHVVDELVREVCPSAIECAPGADAEVVEAARLLAARDGTQIRVEAPEPVASGLQTAPDPPPASAPTEADAARRRRRLPLPRRLDHLRLKVLGRYDEHDPQARRAHVARRLERLGRERGRLLVVLEHARQRVETPSGARFINPYLGPIVERLRGTRLEPIEIDIRSRLSTPDTWLRLNEWDADRLLPSDAVWLAGAPWPPDDCQADAERRADRIEAFDVPLEVAGVDLGPALSKRVAEEARRSLADQLRGATRNRALLRKLRPAGLLLADEYHRQAWLAAADAEGIPTAAVQHGMIYRWHNGYAHRERRPELRLADRTYVFGCWERNLLVDESVYRPDEVRVGGSPRLDLVRPGAIDRDQVRAELGIAPDWKLVVVSGTWGPIYRRFHYPIGLGSLFDRPLPGVHVVVKLHPGEPDEGPYRTVIEGAARSGGFAPPPVTVVQSVDLYRLLAAADAHIGVHSTVLTEAVAAGTPNLLVDGLAGADLLGYVEAGVAHPVRTGADLAAALEHGYGTASEEARRTFLEAHFEPGDASARIADDLLAWL